MRYYRGKDGSDDYSRPDRKTWRTTVQLLWRSLGPFAVCMVLGVLAGYGLWQAYFHGYFVRWQPVEAPPSGVAELLTSYGWPLYVRGLDNKTYVGLGEWQETDLPEEISPNWTVVKPCRMVWPEFSPLARPPRDIAQCLQGEGILEAVASYAYVLDRTGNLWVWGHNPGPYGYLATFVVFIGLGGFAGLVAGGVWAFRIEPRRASPGSP